MSFAEMARYIDGEFEPAIQRAIAGHVQYCNRCQAELARFRATRRATFEVLAAHAPPEPPCTAPASDGAARIDEATMAAFVEGRLDAVAETRLEAHLGQCPACYRQYAAVERELAVTPPAAAPEAARAERLAPVRPPLMRRARARLQGWGQGLRTARPVIPAVTFALGVLAALLIVPMPEHEVIVALPGLDPTAGVAGHAPQGLGGGADVGVVYLPQRAAAVTWPGRVDATDYQVFLFDAADAEVAAARIETTLWSLPAEQLRPGMPYLLLVTAQSPQGQAEVARVRIVQAPD